jgi:hypothetical protein
MSVFGWNLIFSSLIWFRHRCAATIGLPLLLLLGISPASHGSALFEDHTVLEVSVTGPLTTLLENISSREELPFVLRANGVDHKIKLRLRGKSRLEVCSFSPLRLRLSADDTPGTVFAEQNKLKLVTHCRGSSAYQASALREFAAYRIFNIISDIGYRVRLLHISYIDTDEGRKNKTTTSYGFLIESAAGLALRANGTALNVKGISVASLDEQEAAKVFIFQYLIGNTDWSLVRAEIDDRCCHNGDVLEIGSSRYYVPYDFDLSGIVNARYAWTNPALRISRVTQRKYRGYCISPEALKQGLTHINALRADILNVIEEVPGLSLKDRQKTTRFLDGFFAVASDEDKLLRRFERYCL